MQANRGKIDADVLETLLKKKFGDLFGWTLPVTLKTIGPYSPEPFLSFEVRGKQLVDECRSFLEGIPTPDLAILFHPEFDDPDDKRSAWDKLFKSEISDLSIQEPVWIAGGFGHPEYIADTDYWSKMMAFGSDELLLLSVGVDPNKTDVLSIYNLGKYGSENVWQVINYLSNRDKLLGRHFYPNGARGIKIKPVEFLEFVDFVNLPVEAGFLNALRKIHQPSKQNETLDPREKTSLLNLIAVMANDAYRYDPSKRSAVPSEIYDAAKMNRVNISKETIRNHLKNAVGPLTEPWLTK